MSVAAAESKVERCKEALRIAYEELYAAREKAVEQAHTTEADKLRSANAKMEQFCAEHLARINDEHGIARLPVRLRFVVCAQAAGMSRKEIAEAMPKINGKRQFMRMGISVGGLSKLVSEARYELSRLSMEGLKR